MGTPSSAVAGGIVSMVIVAFTEGKEGGGGVGDIYKKKLYNFLQVLFYYSVAPH